MLNWNRKSELYPETGSFSTRSHRWALGAVLVVCLWFSGSLAADSPQSAWRYSLTPQTQAVVGDDGSLAIISENSPAVVLQGHLDPLADSRRRRGGQISLQSLVSLAQEGQTGGQRGFSAQADDDGDGLVDEDPLDGLDNDGDGRIDEDFAAISDAMTVVHLSQGTAWAQLGFMQWAGPRLQNALFLDFSASHELNGVTIPYYHLESTGNPWREIDVSCRRHDLSGQSIEDHGTAFVVRMDSASRASDDPGSAWLGVLVLKQPLAARGHARQRPLLEGNLLSLPLTDEPLAAVVCHAPSWMQLNRLLLDAVAVHQGVTDPVSNRQVPWIVSPLCSRCRLEKTVDFSVEMGTTGQLSLSVRLQPGLSGLMDPDLFTLAGRPLGPPSEIVWESEEDPWVATSWGEFSPYSLDSPSDPFGDLYGLLGDGPGHEARGSLVFVFANPAEKLLPLLEVGNSVELRGTWLDGRAFAAQGSVVRDIPAETSAPRADSAFDAGSESAQPDSGRLSLAPGLLEGWPNPFRDLIRIEFVVPSSVRETFDWSGNDPLPEGVDLSAPMAWAGGQPTVSVKVYSINGQELVSLQHGRLGEGHYTVTWNGADAFGRQVASGTYFCKLQLNDWSVTRRLVFIR